MSESSATDIIRAESPKGYLLIPFPLPEVYELKVPSMFLLLILIILFGCDELDYIFSANEFEFSKTGVMTVDEPADSCYCRLTICILLLMDWFWSEGSPVWYLFMNAFCLVLDTSEDLWGWDWKSAWFFFNRPRFRFC